MNGCQSDGAALQWFADHCGLAREPTIRFGKALPLVAAVGYIKRFLRENA